MNQCIICKKKAKFRFSPDMDIQGIGTCKKHQSDVQIAYGILLTIDEKMFWDFIKTHKDFRT